GHQWSRPPVTDSVGIVVAGVDTPPAADTRWMGPRELHHKIVPARFHVPPARRMLVPVEDWTTASQSDTGAPPDAEIFLSLESAKNATNWPSGDQNGAAAPVVPARGCAVTPAIGRTQSWLRPSGPAAVNARREP